MESEDNQNNTLSENEDQFETPHICDEQNDINVDEQNAKLEERLNSLKETMNILREQLHEEKEAWKREIEEAFKVAKAVGVSYHECYKQCAVPKPDYDMELTLSEPTLKEISLSNYEQKLACYQEALTRAHAEKRNMLKRQLAVNAFKRRLIEVENLCNVELMKLKQSVQYLQPLRTLANGWETPVSTNMVEDVSAFDEELTGKTKAIEATSTKSSNADSKSEREFVTLETLEQKMYLDFKDISSQFNPLSSHATCTSLSLTDEDPDLMMKPVQSVNIWFNNEVGDTQHSAFNPLM